MNEYRQNLKIKRNIKMIIAVRNSQSRTLFVFMLKLGLVMFMIATISTLGYNRKEIKEENYTRYCNLSRVSEIEIHLQRVLQ